MKKILFVLMALLLTIFAGCSKDNKDNTDNSNTTGPYTPPKEETAEEKLLKEYNINKPGLTLEAWGSAGTNYILLNGRIDNKLWVGYYDIQTKQPLLDWTDSNVLDTIVTLDQGYGEGNITHKINRFFIYKLCSNGGIFSFTLVGCDDNMSISDQAITGYLYFIKDGQLINIHKESWYSLRGRYTNVYPWFEGFMVGSTNNEYPDSYFTCFDTQGNKLFEVSTMWSNSYSSSRVSVNYEEGIYLNSFYSTFSRINVKDGIVIWSSSGEPFILPENAKRGDLVVEKLTEDTWKYSLEYTQYDGTKGSVSVLLNINTGTYEKSE